MYFVTCVITEPHKAHFLNIFLRKLFCLFPQGEIVFPRGYIAFPKGRIVFPQGKFISTGFMLFLHVYIDNSAQISEHDGKNITLRKYT